MNNSIEFKNNSLTLVRYIVAIRVLVGHLFRHFNCPMDAFNSIFGIITTVPIFFCISGFLLNYSLEKDDNYEHYFKKRFLRIYPELWLCVLIGLVVILVQYPSVIADPFFYLFGITQSTFLQFWTPSSLNFYGVGVPNGPLWTICIFVQFYILVYFFRKIIKNTTVKKDILILCTLVLIASLYSYLELLLPTIIYKLACQFIIPYAYVFYIGMMICKYREIILPRLVNHFYIYLVMFLLLIFLQPYFEKIPHIYFVNNPASIIINCLFWISFAYKFNSIKIKLDLSFGIYLYHMIFVNLFVDKSLTTAVYAIAVVLLSVVCAYISNKATKAVIRRCENGE